MQTVERHRTTDGEYNSSICIRNCSFVLIRATKGHAFLVRLGHLCVTSLLKNECTRSYASMKTFGSDTCNTYKITSCARITQPASSWMHILNEGRVCFMCSQGRVPPLHIAKERMSQRERVATSLSESMSSRTLTLLRSFLPFRVLLFFPTAMF